MSDVLIPRRSQRLPVTLTAQCRTLSGMRDKGEISDITAEGCRLRTLSLMLRVGSRVLVRPQGLESLSGVVRWVRGDLAGVEFDRPLYVPIVEHLANLHRSADIGA